MALLCSSVAIWLCGYVATWLSGYGAMWLCCYVAMGLYGYVAKAYSELCCASPARWAPVNVLVIYIKFLNAQANVIGQTKLQLSKDASSFFMKNPILKEGASSQCTRFENLRVHFQNRKIKNTKYDGFEVLW